MTSLTEDMARQIPSDVQRLLKRLREGGYPAFLVGGSVRDMLRGEAPKDFDVATSARPEQVQTLFRKVIPTGIEHGTVTVLSGALAIEVTTFRSEGKYEDGRRPSEVHFETDIEQDLSRRDFTINAIAFDPLDGALRDPFGGQADLAARCVRTVGEPRDRFNEDGLRPLRAVRFATVLNFELEPRTEAAIPQTLDVFRKVAAERVRDELGKILLSPRAAWGLERLSRVGLLKEILPELSAVEGEPSDATLKTVAALPEEWSPRLAALLLPISAPAPVPDPQLGFALANSNAARKVLKRLRLPRQTVMDAEALIQLHPAWLQTELSPPVVRRLASRAGLARLPQLGRLLRAVAEAREMPTDPRVWLKLIDQIVADPPPLAVDGLAIDGAAVMRFLGVKPSPVVGEALRFLLNEVLNDPKLNRPEVLQEKLSLWVQSQGR